MTASPALCPLCGHPNNCGMAAGKGACWCFSEKIAPEVLERIRPELRGEVCVCRTCALGGVRDTSEAQQRLREVLRRR